MCPTDFVRSTPSNLPHQACNPPPAACTVNKFNCVLNYSAVVSVYHHVSTFFSFPEIMSHVKQHQNVAADVDTRSRELQCCSGKRSCTQEDTCKWESLLHSSPATLIFHMPLIGGVRCAVLYRSREIILEAVVRHTAPLCWGTVPTYSTSAVKNVVTCTPLLSGRS